MTNQQQPPFIDYATGQPLPTGFTPSPGYYLAGVSMEESANAAEKHMRNGIKQAIGDYKVNFALYYRNAYPTPPRDEWVALVNRKPVEPMQNKDGTMSGSWTGQKSKYPNEFDAAMKKWTELEPVSPRRGQVLRAIALIEALEMGQGSVMVGQ